MELRGLTAYYNSSKEKRRIVWVCYGNCLCIHFLPIRNRANVHKYSRSEWCHHPSHAVQIPERYTFYEILCALSNVESINHGR